MRAQKKKLSNTGEEQTHKQQERAVDTSSRSSRRELSAGNEEGRSRPDHRMEKLWKEATAAMTTLVYFYT
jgi:hypothetical protein